MIVKVKIATVLNNVQILGGAGLDGGHCESVNPPVGFHGMEPSAVLP